MSDDFLPQVPNKLSDFFSFRFISILWSYELSVMHSGRPDATGTMVCTVPWGSIPTHISFLAEFLGTLVLGVGIKLILDNKTLANNDPIYTAGIIAGE